MDPLAFLAQQDSDRRNRIGDCSKKESSESIIPSNRTLKEEFKAS